MQTAAPFAKTACEKLSDRELYEKCRLYGGNARAWSKKFAALLPEVERRRLYEKYGFYSVFEFAAKLAGMGRETVLEILRVAEKLQDKPLLLAQLLEHGCRCAYPDCQKLPEIYHHTRRFALFPNHDPDFLTPLCKSHERLAHYGLIKNEEQPSEQWQVKTEADKTSPKYWIDRKVNAWRIAQ